MTILEVCMKCAAPIHANRIGFFHDLLTSSAEVNVSPDFIEADNVPEKLARLCIDNQVIITKS